jgi:NAD(P)-dependent dehydrogenase (short-subunit alcohol dehydrogenase family)
MRNRRDHGRLDIVVANAGGAELVSFAEVTEKQFNERFDINVKGLFFTVQKALPLLLAPDGIRVNTLSPGPIQTPSVYGLVDDTEDAQARLRKCLVRKIPLGRLGRPEEVAAAAVFLASDQSSFSTGGELFVDGGFAQI